MDYQTVSNLVKTGSPLLANLLMSPNAELAQAALGRTLANDDQASLDDIAAAISKVPDALLKVRQAEEQLLSRLAANGVTIEQLDAQVQAKRLDTLMGLEQIAQRDRQDARQRQIQTHDATNGILAYSVTLGFFLVLAALIATKYIPLPKDAGDSKALDAVLQTLLGVLGTAWVSIITFYFGSSIGSKEKTALLAEDVSANNSLTS
jgi:uncharacterized protein YhaN